MRPVLAIAMRRRRVVSSCSTMYCSALAPVKRARSLETVLPAVEKTRSEVTLVAGIESRYLAPSATRGTCISFSRYQSSAVPRDPWSTVRPRQALHSTSRGTPPPEPAPNPGLAPRLPQPAAPGCRGCQRKATGRATVSTGRGWHRRGPRWCGCCSCRSRL